MSSLSLLSFGVVSSNFCSLTEYLFPQLWHKVCCYFLKIFQYCNVVNQMWRPGLDTVLQVWTDMCLTYNLEVFCIQLHELASDHSSIAVPAVAADLLHWVTDFKSDLIVQRWNRSRFSWPYPTGNLFVKPAGLPAKITTFRSDIATPNRKKQQYRYTL